MTQQTRIVSLINRITKGLYPITSDCARHRHEMMFKRGERAHRIFREMEGLPVDTQEELLKTMYDAISKTLAD